MADLIALWAVLGKHRPIILTGVPRYRSGGAGDHRGVVKLGVEELLRHLVVAGVVPVAGVLDPRSLPIEVLGELPSDRRVMYGAVWRLSMGYRTLGDVAKMNFAELVATPGVGTVAAQKIEVALASLSVLLRDGDQELLRRAPAPGLEDPAPSPAPSAEQARATCGRALLLLGKWMLGDGSGVIAIAAQVEVNPDNARKQLRMYSRDAKRTSAAEVGRLAAPILATGKAATKRRRGRRAGPGASENATENVVPVVFRK